MDIQEAKNIIRAYFEDECKPYGIAQLEIKYGSESIEKGVMEFVCNVWCRTTFEIREVILWLNKEGKVIYIKEQSRKKIV